VFTGDRNVPALSFVNEHYYCESRNDDPFKLEFGILYTSIPLWNGEGCEKNDTCCADAVFPCQFPAAKQEDVEIRSCHDQSINDEVVLINQLQLFMRSELT